MNGSSLFGGESFGTLYEDGATFKQASTGSTGVFLNVTDEKGIFEISTSDPNAILNITIDGNSFQGSVNDISTLTGSQNSATASFFVYKKSLRVETISNVNSYQVVIDRLS